MKILHILQTQPSQSNPKRKWILMFIEDACAVIKIHIQMNNRGRLCIKRPEKLKKPMNTQQRNGTTIVSKEKKIIWKLWTPWAALQDVFCLHFLKEKRIHRQFLTYLTTLIIGVQEIDSWFWKNNLGRNTLKKIFVNQAVYPTTRQKLNIRYDNHWKSDKINARMVWTIKCHLLKRIVIITTE